MKKEMNYVAPDLEVIEVMVEAGFATSSETGGNAAGWGIGDDQTDGWDD